MNKIRMTLAAACLASALFAPWWLTLAIAVALCARFRAWEIIGIGIIMDLLWLPGDIALAWQSIPLATVVATALVFGLEPLRRQLLTGPEIL